jgi:ribosomal protein S18 acetylase RimI-like enzyme
MIRLQPMLEREFADYRSQTVGRYAAQLEIEGEDPERAHARAVDAIDKLLPLQHQTPAHHLFTLKSLEGNTSVGYLWLGKDPTGEADSAYIYEIFVHSEFRGRGFGESALREAETWATQSGKTTLTLNVFWHNTGARRLYDRLGFVATRVRMSKPVDGVDRFVHSR